MVCGRAPYLDGIIQAEDLGLVAESHVAEGLGSIGFTWLDIKPRPKKKIGGHSLAFLMRIHINMAVASIFDAPISASVGYLCLSLSNTSPLDGAPTS